VCQEQQKQAKDESYKIIGKKSHLMADLIFVTRVSPIRAWMLFFDYAKSWKLFIYLTYAFPTCFCFQA
jgi:hypothetical protein